MLAALGVFGTQLEALQVHYTSMVIYAVAMITAFIRPYDGLESELLQALELLSLTAIFFTVWAGTVFLEYPKCEKGLDPITGRIVTYNWCDIISILAGVADIISIILFALTYTRMKIGANIYTCGKKVQKKTSTNVNKVIQRARGESRLSSVEIEMRDRKATSVKSFSLLLATQRAAEVATEQKAALDKELKLSEEKKPAPDPALAPDAEGPKHRRSISRLFDTSNPLNILDLKEFADDASSDPVEKSAQRPAQRPAQRSSAPPGNFGKRRKLWSNLPETKKKPKVLTKIQLMKRKSMERRRRRRKSLAEVGKGNNDLELLDIC